MRHPWQRRSAEQASWLVDRHLSIIPYYSIVIHGAIQGLPVPAGPSDLMPFPSHLLYALGLWSEAAIHYMANLRSRAPGLARGIEKRITLEARCGRWSLTSIFSAGCASFGSGDPSTWKEPEV